jgi:hypothetical protein
MARIWNFTPHKVTIVLTGLPDVEFPSDGSVRLASAIDDEPFEPNDRRTLHRPGDNLAIPTIWPQEASDFDKASVDLMKQVKVGDSMIVSMIVAQWLQKHGKKHGWDDYGDEGNLFKPGVRVYVPATGPKHVVRNTEGQIIAVRALEFYCNLEKLV